MLAALDERPDEEAPALGGAADDADDGPAVEIRSYDASIALPQKTLAFSVTCYKNKIK